MMTIRCYVHVFAVFLVLGIAGAAPGVALAGCHHSAPELYQKVSPAVVLIEATTMKPYAYGNSAERSSGSGVLIDPSGLIVTNSHVVFDQQILTVTLDDGTTLPAQLVGADPVFDIAVIRISKSSPGEKLPVAELGESAGIQVGEEVYALGNPFGLEQTLTRGIVSAVNRVLSGAAWNLKEPMIQTDAAINHGNSGGPIVDSCGKVVGIATAILPEAQNIGFAIPIDLVKKVIPDLIQKGHVVRPWLGVQGQLVSSQLKTLLKAPLVDGLLVELVEPGSPAAAQGVHGGDLDLIISGAPVLLGGDIITEIDGRPIGDTEKLNAAFETMKVGDTVELTLFHEEATRKARVTLSERPVLPRDLPDTDTAAIPVRQGLRALQGRLLHPLRIAF